jgi:pyruvate/2-oxoglutarate dehydrogenase complex dihydrolipoamide dehydrogenase (E3) component
MKEFDAIIIGFGKGGKTLAADLAKRGQSVAVVERSDKMYGGTCINIGCIPTKTMVHQAKIATIKQMKTLAERKAFYHEAIAIKDNVTAMLRNKNYHNLADNDNISVFTGMGSFVAQNVVEIVNGDERMKIKASKIFINTGAETVVPPIEGVAGNPHVYTSTTMMDLDTLPERLVIVGGGYIGLEFASIYASFGSQVTVLESFATLIGREDRDIADAVKAVLEKKGVTFQLSATVLSIKDNGNDAIVSYKNAEGQQTEQHAEAVLLATGRLPNTSGLNLEAAGVKTDERGAIAVNEHLLTTNPHVWAMGDVKGGLQFTYVSLDDYRIVRESLLGSGERNVNDRNPIVYSVFIDPPLSRIGIGEDEARRQGLDVTVKKLPVMAVPRAKTIGVNDGLMKAVIDNKTNKILGCTLFAPDSSEVINTVALAMKCALDYTALHNFIFTHPSMSESLNDLF